MYPPGGAKEYSCAFFLLNHIGALGGDDARVFADESGPIRRLGRKRKHGIRLACVNY